MSELSISKEEFIAWKNSKATKKFLEVVQREIDANKEMILGLDCCESGFPARYGFFQGHTEAFELVKSLCLLENEVIDEDTSSRR